MKIKDQEETSELVPIKQSFLDSILDKLRTKELYKVAMIEAKNHIFHYLALFLI
ncbi:hypothetical protein J5U22_01187 [Saccharolobus shibatae]|uniref:Uncharacterized protein n=1 Tax=Saccharolobus shibatae TaxID=2286 RepID=A0A8F5C0D9_9CREN|nr:hypothetical protein J5U21_01270 [Saccharolobus shibatae]QXJ34640.1 hypothetical protein J5U22_01187 [Saccharolobus shibatae]